MFDSIKDILKFQGKEINQKNILYVNVQLYNILRDPNAITKMLNGKPMKVHIIDILDED